MKYWNRFNQPPKEALKPISAGRLRGKSDINPQWRLKAMTEVFGPCGVGWKYRVTSKETYECGKEIMAAVEIELFVRDGDSWSEPIPGMGGAMLYVQERSGMYCNDEAFKMATTDALSVAMKQLGVAADIYQGFFDGSKYVVSHESQPTKNIPPNLQKLINKIKENKAVLEKTSGGKRFLEDARKMVSGNKELTEDILEDWLTALEQHVKEAENANAE